MAPIKPKPLSVPQESPGIQAPMVPEIGRSNYFLHYVPQIATRLRQDLDLHTYARHWCGGQRRRDETTKRCGGGSRVEYSQNSGKPSFLHHCSQNFSSLLDNKKIHVSISALITAGTNRDTHIKHSPSGGAYRRSTILFNDPTCLVPDGFMRWAILFHDL
ncbi:hypothetical protein BDD12DRAFT_426771 [Trichophaea hybrida]|nr:hypothetical protein BDD12DRAFT_426771 [Trichophaea hybrida]